MTPRASHVADVGCPEAAEGVGPMLDDDGYGTAVAMPPLDRPLSARGAVVKLAGSGCSCTGTWVVGPVAAPPDGSPPSSKLLYALISSSTCSSYVRRCRVYCRLAAVEMRDRDRRLRPVRSRRGRRRAVLIDDGRAGGSDPLRAATFSLPAGVPREGVRTRGCLGGDLTMGWTMGVDALRCG